MLKCKRFAGGFGNEEGEPATEALVFDGLPISWWERDLPEAGNRRLEFHRDEKALPAFLRGPRDPAGQLLSGAIVLQLEFRVCS